LNHPFFAVHRGLEDADPPARCTAFLYPARGLEALEGLRKLVPQPRPHLGYDIRMRVRHLIAFDTETTGFSPVDNRLIELGAVKFLPSGHELDAFETLVCPGAPLPPEVARLTGLSDASLASAPSPFEAVTRFLQWAGEGSLFLAHNAIFDLRFFNSVFLQQGYFVPALPVVDTLPWVRSMRLSVADHSLQCLLKHIGYQPCGAHRSLSDARGLSVLVCRLLQGNPDPLGALTPWLVQPRRPAKTETSFDLLPR
jgi:DNA polymerase III alpha subunit (gram-positive type)